MSSSSWMGTSIVGRGICLLHQLLTLISRFCYFRADSFEYLTIWFVFFLLVMLCTFRRESCFYARVQPEYDLYRQVQRSSSTPYTDGHGVPCFGYHVSYLSLNMTRTSASVL